MNSVSVVCQGTADDFLIAAAVGSDVLGVALVLLAAMSLLHLPAKFAATPCGGTDLTLALTDVAIEVKA